MKLKYSTDNERKPTGMHSFSDRVILMSNSFQISNVVLVKVLVAYIAILST